jgi:hypothetical protein
MKIRYKKTLFYIALILFLCACKDPVFYAISQEVKPVDPLISGVPTNFAVFNKYMYVAAGKTIYAYNGSWNGERHRPGGNVLQIASTGEYLYALCSTDQNDDKPMVIRRLDGNSSWSQLGGILGNYSKIHNIFAAGGILFILATSSVTDNNIYYSIIYIDDDNPDVINLLNAENPGNAGELTGAAYNGAYYLSTFDRGVYKIDDINNGVSLIASNINFTGIINLEDDNGTILLISRNGFLYTVKDAITSAGTASMGGLSTGALAIWRENDSNRLLLAGRQDSLSVSSGYKYGYLELKLDSNGIESGVSFTEPGINPLSTVKQSENERYQSTIGKYPVNYIFQTPAEIDGNMILFASTQKNGVWSYRVRGGLYQWNAEE